MKETTEIQSQENNRHHHHHHHDGESHHHHHHHHHHHNDDGVEYVVQYHFDNDKKDHHHHHHHSHSHSGDHHHKHGKGHHKHIDDDPQNNIDERPLVEKLINLRIISLIAILLLIPVLFTRIGELKHAIDLYSLQNIAVRYFVCRQAVYAAAWFSIMLFFVFYFVLRDKRDTIYINVRYIKRVAVITSTCCFLKCLVTIVYLYHSRDVYDWYMPNNLTEVAVWGLLGTFFLLYWRHRNRHSRSVRHSS